jgi:hypothetical protein
MSWWSCAASVKPEHPDTLAKFQTQLEGLSWSAVDRSASLQKVFAAASELADAELRYYFRKRRTASKVSFASRVVGVVAGSAGLLIPLIGAAHESAKWLSPWGYVSIAVAGCIYGLDRLFSGTSGHTSYVTAQLAILKLIAVTRIKWTRHISILKEDVTDSDLALCLDLTAKFLEDLYQITSAETGVWEASMTKAIEEAKAGSKTG